MNLPSTLITVITDMNPPSTVRIPYNILYAPLPSCPPSSVLIYILLREKGAQVVLVGRADPHTRPSSCFY